MALNVQRSYALGKRCTNAGLLALSSFPAASRTLTRSRRSYATESALVSKSKGAASAKATHSSVGVDSAGTKKSPVRRGHVDTAKPSTLAKGKASTPGEAAKAKEASKLSFEEQQIKEMEAVEQFRRMVRTSDVWGQPVPDSLDVIFYRPAGLTSIKNFPSVKDWWTQLWRNRRDDAKNAISLLYLASDDAIPGVTLGKKPWYKSFGWLVKVFTARSIRPNTWTAPLRKIAVDTYTELNKTIARADTKLVKTLSVSQFQSDVLRRVKKQPSNYRFVWNLEREVSPTKILSLRAVQYHLGKEDPKFGSRYLVHALVKFDTEQSLECYGPKGQPLHEPAENAERRSNGTLPAKPKRVTEYLILEKRLWYDGPWTIREQLWDAHQKA